MSPKLPREVSGKEAIGVFEKVGDRVVRAKGSHVRLRDDDNQEHRPITVPRHTTLKPGLLRKLIHDAPLDVETFLGLRAK